MFDIVCVTNSLICRDDFLIRLEMICKGGISRVILREKHLRETEYTELFKKANEICGAYNVPLFAHGITSIAEKLNSRNIHLPYPIFISYAKKLNKNNFNIIGTSIHSVFEAMDAEKNGANYITAGHIFKTDCKKGLSPRGLEFLSNVRKSVSIPIYAIGGITPRNINSVKECGANGVCIMSALMKAENPAEYLKRLRNGN